MERKTTNQVIQQILDDKRLLNPVDTNQLIMQKMLELDEKLNLLLSRTDEARNARRYAREQKAKESISE